MEEVKYNELDPKCVEFVKYFNKVGLETAMCCQGHNKENLHKYWISFSKKVTDKDIMSFIDSFPRPFYAKRDNKQIMGKFLKVNFGMTIEGEDLSRWRYEADSSGNSEVNQELAEADLEIFKEYVNGSNVLNPR